MQSFQFTCNEQGVECIICGTDSIPNENTEAIFSFDKKQLKQGLTLTSLEYVPVE